MRLLGADEAGKGPVIGSMFVAGVVIEEDQLFDLAALGVKDSKMLSPKRRAFLAAKIEKIAQDRYVLEVKPEVIDELRQLITMNEIMVKSFSKVVGNLSADRAILDAADVNQERFARRVKEGSGTSMEVIAEHRADKNHIVVAAASILAKVNRDRSVRELERTIGLEIGSGYPSDPTTVRFLETWMEEHGELPPFVRHSWKTAERIKARFI
ncbi:MAG TPA: ribonuclease HII [Methanotrichaceae archaeon]|nr:ribonuclease HII [Methanotrichaceae archaeon]